MTPVETAKVLTALHAAFPRQLPATAEMTEATIKIWHDMAGHLAYDVAAAAARRTIATVKFMPSIAEFLEAAAAIQFPARLTAAEAWELVVRALRDWRPLPRATWVGDELVLQDCSNPTVPPTVARTVQAMGGWRALSAGDEPGVDRAQFLRLYDGLAERERIEDKLPPAVKRLTAGLAEQLALPGRERKVP